MPPKYNINSFLFLSNYIYYCFEYLNLTIIIKLHFVQQNYNIHIILYSIFWKNTWATFKQKHENIVTTYKKLKSPITKNNR